MINWLMLSAFVPTFFLVSITPGLCMTMAMSLGLSVGVKRALWIFLGYELWLSKGRLALDNNTLSSATINRKVLAWQGFISPDHSVAIQLPILILIILVLEFICLLIYTAGGKTIRVLLQSRQNVKLINRLAGTLMVGVGIWLMAS